MAGSNPVHAAVTPDGSSAYIINASSIVSTETNLKEYNLTMLEMIIQYSGNKIDYLMPGLREDFSVLRGRDLAIASL